MGYNFNFSFGKSTTPTYVERDSNGNFWYQITEFLNGTKTAKFKTERARINAVLLNPAALRVSTLLADITSQGKVESYINDELKDNNWLYSLQERPNDWQTWTDFLYDYSFFRFLGNAYLYKQGDVMYFYTLAA